MGPMKSHGKTWSLLTEKVKLDGLAATMEGRFTKLFPELPGATFPQAALEKLAGKMTAQQEGAPTPETEVDPEENTGIEAVYTYMGQFIDHDLDFDNTSSLTGFVPDPTTVVDFRTPRLDLDNLYGRGPDDEPFMYDAAGLKFIEGDPMTGNPFDQGVFQVPRSPNGRALIGDPRNDENRIVSQFHAMLLRFHNRMADKMQVENPGVSIQEVRDQVRWHYQWVVVHDFLPTICNKATYQSVLADPYHPVFRIPGLQGKDPNVMPVEFAVAAYRFGHSMIRPQYRLNTAIQRRPIFSMATDPAADMGGFRPIPSDWAIDWQFFLDIGDTAKQDPLEDPIVGDPNATPADPTLGTRKPQHAYKIDTSLVSPLGALPAVVAINPSILALRNLERGNVFQLPTGQAVAHALNEPVLRGDQLAIGKATGEPDDISAQQLIGNIDPAFVDHCPLWTYVLAEAAVRSWEHDPDTGAPLDPNDDKDTKNARPIRLGPVGGRIVVEVFASILRGDADSFIHHPEFAPRPEFTTNGAFGLADLINAAIGRKG